MNNVLKKIEEYVHTLDPLNLGGAEGEYSDVVFRLYKLCSAKKFTESDIKAAFKDKFGELASAINPSILLMLGQFLNELEGVPQDKLRI